MANASRDENNVPTILGVLDTDGVSVVKIEADPATHVLQVENSSTGSDNGGDGTPLIDDAGYADHLEWSGDIDDLEISTQTIP